jgi:hypothetical protein
MFESLSWLCCAKVYNAQQQLPSLTSPGYMPQATNEDFNAALSQRSEVGGDWPGLHTQEFDLKKFNVKDFELSRSQLPRCRLFTPTTTRARCLLT